MKTKLLLLLPFIIICCLMCDSPERTIKEKIVFFVDIGVFKNKSIINTTLIPYIEEKINSVYGNETLLEVNIDIFPITSDGLKSPINLIINTNIDTDVLWNPTDFLGSKKVRSFKNQIMTATFDQQDLSTSILSSINKVKEFSNNKTDIVKFIFISDMIQTNKPTEYNRQNCCNFLTDKAYQNEANKNQIQMANYLINNDSSFLYQEYIKPNIVQGNFVKVFVLRNRLSGIETDYEQVKDFWRTAFSKCNIQIDFIDKLSDVNL